MSRNDLENILREHLSGELDAQRGKAADAFASQVLLPMRRRLDDDAQARAARWKHAATMGLAMAACLAIGLALPRLLTRNDIASDSDSTASDSDSSVASAAGNAAPIEPQVVDFEHTRMMRRIDSGPVLLNDDTPARRIRQQQLDHFRWTDPAGGQYEYVTPSEQELLLQSHRQ